MINETCEDKRENDKIRMDIINMVMEIPDAKTLKIIQSVSRSLLRKIYKEIPMNVIDLAAMTSTQDLIRILKALEEAEPGQIAVEQMQEAFQNALKGCSDDFLEEERMRTAVRELDLRRLKRFIQLAQRMKGK